ncbi:hypothetical protein F0562_000518 [Nyssa sinensis]|uniref:Uncharacterized protein n=1 Tax=Nyssa sinensis TaxID=561372 RepID=A0A5J5C1W4_9ASTE|nr:hypothetical protein F0562_000518 [Nyssa sinensis]
MWRRYKAEIGCYGATNGGDNGTPSLVMRTRTGRRWAIVYDVGLMEKTGGSWCGVSDSDGCLSGGDGVSDD